MKEQGISLITLVITIIVVIILAGAVILNLSDNNPIESATKAVVTQDIEAFRIELLLKLTKDFILDTSKVNATAKEDIIRYIPSMENRKVGSTLYTDILVVSEGELKVDGTKGAEKVTSGDLSEEQYNWIVEALGNNVFNAQTYTIKYYANDGTENYTESSKIHNVKYSIQANSAERDGYGFKNWNTVADGTGEAYNAGDEYIGNAELSLYAQWEAGTYTITYNKNDETGGEKTALKTTDVTYVVADQAFEREGYTFVGYNTASDGTGTAYAVGASYTENAELTLYAQWTLKTYEVTYNANNGTGQPSTQTKNYGESLTLSTTEPTRSGYTFVEWNTASDGTGTTYSKGASYTTNENVTLYAIWGISAADAKAAPSTYYGAYVDYTPKNGCPVKWRVFYADSTNIYLIAEDYVENKYLTDTGLIKSTSTTGNQKDYCVKSVTSRQDLVTRLTEASYYTQFKDAVGKAKSVAGAPTLEQFAMSYNAVNTDMAKQMDILYNDSSSTASAEGYLLRFGNSGNYDSYITIPSDANKKDLYMRTDATNAGGMWLASFSACESHGVLIASYDGDVGSNGFFGDYMSVRPLVSLTSEVKMVDLDGDGIYSLK